MTIPKRLTFEHSEHNPQDQADQQHAMSKERTIKTMFIISCCAAILINLDHGILPACTSELMKDQDLNEVEIGLLGSLVFFGLVSGSLVAGFVFRKYPSKLIICCTTVGNILSLFLFPISNTYLVLSFSRMLTGFCQVFAVIYFPVWIDRFGKQNKTKWLTIIQLSTPLGIFLGYAMTAFFVTYANWRYSFYTQVILLIPCFVFFSVFKREYMATSNIQNDSVLEEQSQIESHLLANEDEQMEISDSESYSEIQQELRDKIDLREFSAPRKSSDLARMDSMLRKASYVDTIKLLLRNKVYVCIMLSMCSLYFVVTGVQFWMTDYMRVTLGAPPEHAFLAFAILTLTAPTGGVIFGGLMLDKLGGYTSPKAIDYSITNSILAAAVGIPVPFVSFGWVVILQFFQLFFGGSLMPAMQGMMLSAIPRQIRATGSSTAQLFFNLLGYFPSPFLYGLVLDITGNRKSNMGIILLMAWAFWGFFFLGLAKKEQHKQVRVSKSFAAKENISDIKVGESDAGSYRPPIDIELNDLNPPKAAQENKFKKAVEFPPKKIQNLNFLERSNTYDNNAIDRANSLKDPNDSAIDLNGSFEMNDLSFTNNRPQSTTSKKYGSLFNHGGIKIHGFEKFKTMGRESLRRSTKRDSILSSQSLENISGMLGRSVKNFG